MSALAQESGQMSPWELLKSRLLQWLILGVSNAPDLKLNKRKKKIQIRISNKKKRFLFHIRINRTDDLRSKSGNLLNKRKDGLKKDSFITYHESFMPTFQLKTKKS